ncbi:MAG: hypothetical protein IAE79_03435 [Anaerolinea sp.]|nr:hypothetical protein [Anaerolinea sp.]
MEVASKQTKWINLSIKRPSLWLGLIVLLAIAGGLVYRELTAVHLGQSSVGLTPLTELGRGTYHGAQGGLYPGGSNKRPSAHEAAGIEIAEGIRPLAQGRLF